MRLGWLVLPESIIDDVLEAKGPRELWAGVIDQLARADFIACGAYDRHLHHMRQSYRRRRDLLVGHSRTAPRTSGSAASRRACTLS